MEQEKTFEQRVDETIIYSPSLAINLRKFLKELYNEGIVDVPNDGIIYGRRNKHWEEIFENITNTSQLLNDGADGINPFITESELEAIQEQIDEYQLADTVLQYGTVSISGNTATIPANSFKWRINQQSFLTTPAFTTTINEATAGYYRNDIIVGDDTGNYIKIEGVEDEYIISEPSVPLGTIKLATIPVFGNVVGLPVNDVNGLKEKAEDGYNTISTQASNKSILLNNKTGYIIYGDMTELESAIDTLENSFNRQGREITIVNRTGHDIKIKSNVGITSVVQTIKYFSIKDGDLTLPDGHLIKLKQDPSVFGFFTLVGISNTVNTTGIQNIKGEKTFEDPITLNLGTEGTGDKIGLFDVNGKMTGNIPKQNNSYSTTETLTGGTWIDDKPIYRKVIVLPSTHPKSGTSSYKIDTIPNLDRLLPTSNSSSFRFLGAVDIVINSPRVDLNGYYFIYQSGTSAFFVKKSFDGSSVTVPDYIGSEYTFTLEYTKTIA